MKSVDLIFKPSIKEKLIALVAIIFFLFFTIFIISKNLVLSLFLVALAFIIYVMSEFFGSLNTIKIDTVNRRILFDIGQLHKRQIIEADIKEISITYQQEVGARGTIGNVFNIFNRGQILIKVKPGISGWRDEVLKDILLEVNRIKEESES
ncbi:MAG: hypothetical protein J7604_25035 [Sporocytophaga sp.]|uniref:hypothetical protein n=1 Tax=Sporocytophaga sp. TaxID=2231183 RepID=UPI001B1DD10E|nr:hypothetical protein [Sporocytophaga sp.]MBO9703497.1 hypothetical protein [Sporocytophaga sp.]